MDTPLGRALILDVSVSAGCDIPGEKTNCGASGTRRCGRDFLDRGAVR